jgi:transcriptional regulator with XRE-family HTH domain
MPQPEGEVFGERLRQLREELGLTQRSLADLLGVKHPYISEMEREIKVPSLTTILRLAVGLKCEVTDLVDVFNGRDLRKLIPKRK